MNPVRRRLFACATILSLLLCLATVVSWVRSYWRFDVVGYAKRAHAHSHFVTVSVNFGEVEFFWYRLPVAYFSESQLGWRYTTARSDMNEIRRAWLQFNPLSVPQARHFWFLGFGYFTKDSPPAARGICVPHWFLALLFAVLPAVRLRDILRTRRRNRAGLCPHCGYDLRATPDRCPECGAAAPNLR